MTGTTTQLTYSTGYSFASLMSVSSNVLTINNKSSEEIFKITTDGEIFYKFDDEIIKVKCPEDISEAFLYTVLNYTGYNTEDALIEKYVEKIFNCERSNEYISKLEMFFRKEKLKKINNL